MNCISLILIKYWPRLTISLISSLFHLSIIFSPMVLASCMVVLLGLNLT